MQIERRKPRLGDVCLINLGIDRVRTEGKGLCSQERIGLGEDSMSEKEEREENGFDLWWFDSTGVWCWFDSDAGGGLCGFDSYGGFVVIIL